VPRTAFCFIQSAPTGFTARVFSYHNRDFLKGRSKGLSRMKGCDLKKLLK
jgi:hypothetical protein